MSGKECITVGGAEKKDGKWKLWVSYPGIAIVTAAIVLTITKVIPDGIAKGKNETGIEELKISTAEKTTSLDLTDAELRARISVLEKVAFKNETLIMGLRSDFDRMENQNDKAHERILEKLDVLINKMMQ
jgi:hypothetical protein